MGLILWLIGILVAIGTGYVQCFRLANSDVAWLLYAAQRVLEGARLYDQVIETNPPLIIYLSVLPVWIASHTGISSIVALNILVSVLGIASGTLNMYFLRGSSLSHRTLLGFCFQLALWYVALPMAVSLSLFGEREHLFLLCIAPYICLMFNRLKDIQVSLLAIFAAGILATIGLCLKPYFFILWLSIEFMLLYKRKNILSFLRLENVLIGSLALIYLLIIVIFTPQYISFVAPLMIATYQAYNAPPLFLIWRTVELFLVVIVPVSLLKTVGSFGENASILGVTWGALLTIAVVQLKGWDYHFYPAQAMGVLLLLVMIIEGLQAFQIRSLFKCTACVPLLGMLLAVVGIFFLAGRPLINYYREPQNDRSFIALLAKVKQQMAEGEIAGFFTSMSPMFPLINYSGAQWHSRFNSLSFLPGLYSHEAGEGKLRYHTKAEMNYIEQYIVESVLEDLERYPPELIFVDGGPYKEGFGRKEFNFIEYFSREPRFQKVWANYELLEKVSGEMMYSGGPLLIYKRKGTSS